MISFRQADLLDTVKKNAPKDRYMELRIYSNRIDFVFGPIYKINPKPIMEYFSREVLGTRPVATNVYVYEWEPHDGDTEYPTILIRNKMAEHGIVGSTDNDAIIKYPLNDWDIQQISLNVGEPS